MPTYQELARKYAAEFRARGNAFAALDDVAEAIRSLRVEDRHLSDHEQEMLLSLIRAEVMKLFGGIPTMIRDSSNAGHISLLQALSARLKTTTKG